jgi:hypothetical protein
MLVGKFEIDTQLGVQPSGELATVSRSPASITKSALEHRVQRAEQSEVFDHNQQNKT